jgi:hypothetical protein
MSKQTGARNEGGEDISIVQVTCVIRISVCRGQIFGSSISLAAACGPTTDVNVHTVYAHVRKPRHGSCKKKILIENNGYFVMQKAIEKDKNIQQAGFPDGHPL